MSKEKKFFNVLFRASVLVVTSLLIGLIGVQHAGAQSDERADQEAVTRLAWRVAWGLQSEGDAAAYLGRNLLTEEFFRVRGTGVAGGEAGLATGSELARIPAVAPVIDEDDLRQVSLEYLHISVFALTAIATASTDGADQTFAIMCVETSTGWKIAALQTGSERR